MKAWGPSVRASLQHWPRELAWVREHGYTAVEIGIDEADLIYSGRLHPSRTAWLAEHLGQSGLACSVHTPACLDLRDRAYPRVQLQVALACVQFAAEVGARMVVVHYEQHSGNPGIEAQYEEHVRRLADFAGPHGVALGIENIEVERSARAVEFVASLDLPNVGMTYDFAHDWLASHRFGYDYLSALAEAAPYVRHLHISDNFGRFNELRLQNFAAYKTVNHRELLPLGLGDLHLPAGYGTIPFDQAVPLLTRAGYSGLVITEYERDRYPLESQSIAAEFRSLAYRVWGD